MKRTILIFLCCLVPLVSLLGADRLRERVKAEKITSADKARDLLKALIVEEMDIPRPVLK